jgi:type I restriction enzyme S subunit
MMLLRVKADFKSAMLMYWLNSPAILQRVRELTGGTASPHLNVRDIRAFPVPSPPLPEQQEIVRRVEALFAFADRIEARVASMQKTVERLTPATLAKAFRGELVPQDPNDEPASALLERFGKQAEAKSPKSKRQKRS